MKSKPSKMKYTDLCIYIDKTIYNRDDNNNPISLRVLNSEEEANVYNYLCNLIVALAHTKYLFPTWEQYEEFSYSYAADVFMRLTSKDQDFTPGAKRLKPIKSILNYVKNTIYFAAVTYRNTTYDQTIKAEYEGPEAYDNIATYCEEQVQSQYAKDIREIISDNLATIISKIKQALDESIYSRSKERNDIELSILLSINNFMSLNYSQKSLSEAKRNKVRNKQLNNWENYIILWSDNTNKATVIFLIKKVFEYIKRDIEDEKSDNYLPEDVVKDILCSALPSFGQNNVEEE